MSLSKTAEATVLRCPACGQPAEEPVPPKCSLCGFKFGQQRVTGVDVTPYAASYAARKRGLHAMCEWVWFAGFGRLKHLALMQDSAASARFACMNLLLLAVGLALLQSSVYGWSAVSRSIAVDGRIEPVGDGWLVAARVPDDLVGRLAEEVPATLWWSPVQTIIAVALGFVFGALALWLVLALIRLGLRLAYLPGYRKERRMTAALHYGTAWSLPVFIGLAVISMRSISYVGSIARWSWFPPQYGFELSGAVVAAFGAALWWFWLLRLGSTAPARTRFRIGAFLAIGAPLIVSATAAGYWFGLEALLHTLFERAGLAF